ncbi:MAG: cytochrome c peroxidase [Myxococcales bacterium]|nr:cytochrome c peroxidase [Myxococcales bacterium]
MTVGKAVYGRAVAARGACLALALAGCGSTADNVFCGSSRDCGWSSEQWGKVSQLANLGNPPADRSNAFVGVAAAETLGQKFFFDVRFSGAATQIDNLRRPVLPAFARAAKGAPVALSCASCHDANRAGIDDTSPGGVSIGAGEFDVNAQPTINAAYYPLLFWNGRSDSLWAQALAANEGAVSMNSNRLHDAWVIADFYRADFQAAFTVAPLPMPGRSADVQALLDTDPVRAGQCKLNVTNACPTDLGCREAKDAGGTMSACWPRFPLNGKPGSKAGCQPGDASEPFGDAWDCMPKEDQDLITRVFVTFGKAIAAYEAKLVSRDAPFDHFVNDGPDSGAISLSAGRGARLFVGKAACSECHNTPLLSDRQFHNVGTPQTGHGVPTEVDCPAGGVCDCVGAPAGTAADGSAIAAKPAKNCLPWGARDGLTKLRASAFLRNSSWSDDPTDDSSKVYLSDDTFPLADVPKGAWRTPTLRDVALTGPYMHDGVYQSLQEVVAHYNKGGASDGVGVPAAQLRPLFLSEDEQADLVEFLKSLTGTPLPAELRNAPVLP